jgi:hypothetical protein
MTSRFADDIEREARRLLRARIERLPGYPRLSPPEREAAIRADVDRYWRTMQPEAVQVLQARHAALAAQQAA